MTKGSKNKRIFLSIILSILIFTAPLVSCSKVNDNNSTSTVDTSDQEAADTKYCVEYSVSNLIMDPLLNPLDSGVPSIIKSDTLAKISGIPNPFRLITSSDINNYYEKLKSINELSSEANRIMATVNGEPIYLSDIEKTKALIQLNASTNIRTLQSLSSTSEAESVTDESYSDDSLFSYLNILTSGGSDNSSKLNKYEGWYSISDSEYLAWFIQDKVIIQNALKSGISLSDEDIYTQATIQYDIIDRGNSYMNEMTLKAYGMKKEDYIRNVLMPVMKNYDLIAMFELQYLSKNNAGDCNRAKNKQILKQYVDSLVAQSDVQYK